MALNQAMISVTNKTRSRIYHLKGPAMTYDEIVNTALDAYEEKLNEPRSLPGSEKTGNHEGDQ